MRYVADKTGRFSQRPHYDPSELDKDCELIITQFIREHHGKLVVPIPTEALTSLIERDADDLDLFADLSSEGSDVEGITDFYRDRKPAVRIAKELSEHPRREHRLRTTLTHEYGHVKFHAYLWQVEPEPLQLFGEQGNKRSTNCKRDTMLDAPRYDWMEWQAGYVCGAILMPVTEVKHVVAGYVDQYRLCGRLNVDHEDGIALKNLIASQFDVSEEAAMVRLLKLRYLTKEETSGNIFG